MRGGYLEDLLYSVFQKNLFFCCFIIQNLPKIAKKKKIKKFFPKNYSNLLFFHFPFWPNSKKKILAKKLFTFENRPKKSKSILFWGKIQQKNLFFANYSNVFFFPFIFFIFHFGRKAKKRFLFTFGNRPKKNWKVYYFGEVFRRNHRKKFLI